MTNLLHGKCFFLIIIASTHRVGELHGLQYDQPYIRWSVMEVMLFTRHNLFAQGKHTFPPIHCSLFLYQRCMMRRIKTCGNSYIRRALKHYINSFIHCRKWGTILHLLWKEIQNFQLASRSHYLGVLTSISASTMIH